MKTRIATFALATLALPAFAEDAPALTKEQAAFFESKVRPIFADTCHKCHSLAEGKAKGGLTLDTRVGWQKGGDDGAVIVPGKPEESRLIKAIGYLDPDLQMPPKGEKLTDAQIAVLTEWVKMGAPDPRDAPKNANAKLTGLTDSAKSHYAFQPVVKPALPEVKNKTWPVNEIDRFTLAKLEANGMKPSPAAKPEALLRRLSYDLIGLPPSTDEIETFDRQFSGNPAAAIQQRVDALLSTPHYGERWGRHWLDTARYSDTIGGDRNNRAGEYRYAHAWTYRDWVVNALNSDLPYDQFITQQLAADKLPGNSRENLAALGFLTVGERFRNVNDIINDRIDTVSKAFLGLTVSCARCHDHMFDPVSQKDYYALHGIFASSYEPEEKPLIRHADDPKLSEEFTAKYLTIEKANREQYYRQVGKLNAEFREKTAAYLAAARLTANRATTKEQIDERNRIVREQGLDLETVQAILRRVRELDSVFRPMRAHFRKEFELGAAKAKAKNDEQRRQIDERAGREIREARPANPMAGAAWDIAQPQTFDDTVAMLAQLFADVDAQCRAYHEAAAGTLESEVTGFDPAIRELAQFPFAVPLAAKLDTDGIRKLMQTWPNRMQRDARFDFAGLSDLQLKHDGAPLKAMAMLDKDSPKNSPVFIRGQAEVKGPIVPRQFLAVLAPHVGSGEFSEGSGRLDLAKAIAHPANPLTARVIVNRLWMHHFGEGLVPTPDDLGNMAGKPSHPELLDWLAGWFVENGWSFKKLHKLILTSRTWQQGSATNKTYADKDPENRLLWRANIRRLDFEATRDSLLVFSGHLDRTIGGQPVNLADEPYSYRRSVYGYIDRGNLPELMAQFDFSDPDMPNSRRTSTIVPQQALFLMNSAMSVDVARRVMERPEVANAADDSARIAAIWRVILQRTPGAAEIDWAKSFVADELPHEQEAAPGTANYAKRIAARVAGKAKPNNNGARYADQRPIMNDGDYVARKPLTAWETLAQSLLFSNEAAYVN